MKRKFNGLYLILVAIILIIVDFMTLGNRNFIQSNPKIELAAFIVFVLGILLLIIGIIKSIRDLLLSNWLAARREKFKQEIIDGKRFTRTERTIVVIIALLMVLPVIAINVIIPLIGTIISLPFALMVIYLFFLQRRHPTFNYFLLLLGIYFYFFSGEHFFQRYKMIELAVTPSYGSGNPFFVILISFIFVGCKFFFMLAASWLVIARRRHSLANIGIFLTLITVLLLLPFLYQPKVKFGQNTSGNTSGNGASHFAMNNTTTIMSFDKNTNQYVVTSTLKNNTGEDGPILRVIVDGKDLELSPNNSQLSLENGTISKNSISIPSGQTGILKISSPKPFYCTTLLEKDFRYSNCFLK